MTTSKAMTRRCGGTTRSGGKCKLPAGWGTNHPGFGYCNRHLGSTRTHVRSAAREQAVAFVRGQLGQELDIQPSEGALLAVRLAYGAVDYWRHRLADDPENASELHHEYSRSVMDFARISEVAVRAGVSERYIQLVERLGGEFSLLFERMIAGSPSLTAKQRAELAESYGAAVASLESPAIDGTARDVAA